MWKKGLILQIMSQRDHFQKEKIKNVIGLVKEESSGKILKELRRLRAQTYRYITDNNNESKKARGTKKYIVKRKLKFENYKNCLQGSQLENKIIHLNTNNIDVKGFTKIKKNLQKTIK